MTNPIDFEALNRSALAQCPGLLERLLSGGKQQGNEFVCGNLAGDPGKSCKVNLQSGKWSDFATGAAGGDLISLVAAIENTNQIQGAKLLAKMIGYPLPDTDKRKKEKPVPIIPVPDKAADVMPGFKHPILGYPAETYAYRNTEGRLLGYTCRFNKQELKQNGKLDKVFSTYLYTNQGWKWQGFPIPYPFYGLDRLADLPTAGLVIAVEGEGKADKLQTVMGDGIAVIGIYGGCSKTPNMDYTPLKGKRALYWPDNDEPGFKAALEFIRKAQPVVESLKIIRPPKEAKATWDCADAIEEGWTKDKILDWIGANRLDPDEFAKLANLGNAKPVIRYAPGGIEKATEELEKALQGTVFQNCGRLVNLIRLPEKRTYGKVDLQKSTPVINPLDIDSLTTLALKYADWEKLDSRKGAYIAANPPKPVIGNLAASKGFWTFPSLEGLVTCPIIRFDGTVLDKSGYDEATGLYAVFSQEQFTDIPENPDYNMAEEAHGVLLAALSEFPFRTEVDRAVALAAILTTAIRQSIPHAPLFAFSAPCPGTGKTALANLISIISTGMEAPAFNYTPDPDEMKKALFSILSTGTPVLLIDNITGTVNNSVLNTLITSTQMSDRILGHNTKTITISTNALIMATGNNLTFSDDMTRRTMYAVLDAQEERPAERQFERTMPDWAIEHRPELVTAVITILRAYHLAGYPGAKDLKPLNGFEQWNKWIRGALLWLGEMDPLESQKEIEDYDPERESLRAVLYAWYEHFGSGVVTTKDLLRRGTIINDEPDAQETFYHILLDAASDGKELTSRKLGKWLSAHKGRIIEGLRLIDTGKKQDHIIYWRVVKK